MIASAAQPGAAGHHHSTVMIASAAQPGAAGHHHSTVMIASAAQPGAGGTPQLHGDPTRLRGTGHLT